MKDSSKLRIIADWFDRRDKIESFSKGDELQVDLRRMANEIDERIALKVHLQEEIEKNILKTKLDSSYSPAYKEAKIKGLREALEIIESNQ